MKLEVTEFLKKNPEAMPLLSDLLQRKCRILQNACEECKDACGEDQQKAHAKLQEQDRKTMLEIEEEIGRLIFGNTLPVPKPVERKAALVKTPKAEVSTEEMMLEKLLMDDQTSVDVDELVKLGLNVENLVGETQVGRYKLSKELFSRKVHISKKACACKANVKQL